jgi:hypothetical protein
MSRMTYQDALRLFRSEHFRELIETCNRSGSAREAEPNLRILLAYVFALTDDTNAAATLLDIDLKKLTSNLRPD